jgi:hypothetical protein
MINPIGSKEFSLNAGTIIQIDGSPYALIKETIISGFEEPRFLCVFERPNAKLTCPPQDRQIENTGRFGGSG